LNDTYYRKRESSPDPAPVPLPDQATAPPATGIDLGAQYLVNLTVGEDYANCYSCPNATTCDLQQRYKFNQEVWVQSYSEVENVPTNDTWWYETTDFCYVREVDFWQSLGDCKF